ncbi:hypothetical protein ZEAMMB73_Zm00001d051656 [Zea mays]|uniref:Uncharacterized protein n=1 Tax=Zea mays TaxID=4577 RepID=A0A1D6Q8U8_MAIZE|nr:hypothetical protein ZEAMMB73_Zm00001d051656 [Zea mays]
MITLDSVFLKRITVLKMEKEVRSPFIFPDVVQEYFISANSEEILGIVRDNWLQSGHENLHNSIDEAIMLKVLIKIISDMYHFHAHLWWEIEIQMLSGSTVGIFPSTYDLWDSLFGKSIIC